MKQTKWRDGKGDVVRDYVESSKKFGIKPGIYASVSANAWWEVTNPGLVNWGKGGDEAKQAQYTKACEGMLTELWGNYGPLFEIWFDGGALPPDKGGPDLYPFSRRSSRRPLCSAGRRRAFAGLAMRAVWRVIRAGRRRGPMKARTTVTRKQDLAAGRMRRAHP